MFVRSSTAASRHSRQPGPLREPDVPPSAPGAHRTRGRLLDCLVCLCPRLRHTPAEPSPPSDRTTELSSFRALPAPTEGSIRVTRLKQHPAQARYRLLPPGFPERDALQAYQLPNVDGHTRYHECQDDARCGLHMINMLGMALTGDDYRVLTHRSQLDAFIRDRHGHACGNDYLDEDLRDFHNHGRRCLPALALATAAVMPDGSIAFDVTCGPAQLAEIDAAPAVGLTFHFAHGERATLHSVVVRRTGEALFELLDSRSPQLHFAHAGAMSSALGVFVRQLGRAGEEPQAARLYSMLYPSAAPAAPPGAGDRLTWL